MKKSIKPTRKKLRNTASQNVDNDYFEEESSMRLSRAFVVVLILHVVAVGGILLFNSMKARQEITSPTNYIAQNQATTESSVAATSEAQPAPAQVHVVKNTDTLSKISQQYGVPLSSLIAANNLNAVGGLQVGQRLVIPPKGEAAPIPKLKDIQQVTSSSAKPRAAASTAANAPNTPSASAAAEKLPLPASGTYTVVKGDNPVAIARKFGVNYQELLTLNSISDPTKLQIGQVLKLPEKK